MVDKIQQVWKAIITWAVGNLLWNGVTAAWTFGGSAVITAIFGGVVLKAVEVPDALLVLFLVGIFLVALAGIGTVVQRFAIGRDAPKLAVDESGTGTDKATVEKQGNKAIEFSLNRKERDYVKLVQSASGAWALWNTGGGLKRAHELAKLLPHLDRVLLSDPRLGANPALEGLALAAETSEHKDEEEKRQTVAVIVDAIIEVIRSIEDYNRRNSRRIEVRQRKGHMGSLMTLCSEWVFVEQFFPALGATDRPGYKVNKTDRPDLYMSLREAYLYMWNNAEPVNLEAPPLPEEDSLLKPNKAHVFDPYSIITELAHVDLSGLSEPDSFMMITMNIRNCSGYPVKITGVKGRIRCAGAECHTPITVEREPRHLRPSSFDRTPCTIRQYLSSEVMNRVALSSDLLRITLPSLQWVGSVDLPSGSIPLEGCYLHEDFVVKGPFREKRDAGALFRLTTTFLSSEHYNSDGMPKQND